jgi:hypothetical protein
LIAGVSPPGNGKRKIDRRGLKSTGNTELKIEISGKSTLEGGVRKTKKRN